MADNTIYVTEEGLKKLQEEYHHLVHEVRESVKNDLAEARAQGDLSENADYDAAREMQAQVEARIAELEVNLQNYVLIDTNSKGKTNTVKIGTTVQLEFLDVKEVSEYMIVGSTEADPLHGKLSNETPLAQAILDHKVGDTVEVNVAKPYQVIIISIK